MKAIITYLGMPLLEGANTFKLCWGTRPSFGVFRCTLSDYSQMIEDQGSTGDAISGDLIFGDPDDDQTTPLTLNDIYLVRASIDSNTQVVTLVVADKRITLLHQFGVSDYNTYKSHTITGTEYELDNTNGSDEWTYQDVLDALGIQNGLTVTTDRQLRNLRGAGISYCDILDRIMYDTCSVFFLDPTTGDYSIEKLFDCVNDGDDTTNTSRIVHDVLVEGDSTTLWSPGSIKACYASLSDGGWLNQESFVNGGTIGSRLFYTAYTDSDDGKAATQSFADELATVYAVVGNHFSEVKYDDVIAISPSTTAHEITWSMGPRGALTHIRRAFPMCSTPNVADNLFSFDGFLSLGGGGNLEAFLLASDGGSAGDDTTQCSFTYSIFAWADTSKTTALATGITLFDNGARIQTGEMSAATVGIAFKSGDTYVLISCNEQIQTTSCSGAIDGGSP